MQAPSLLLHIHTPPAAPHRISPSPTTPPHCLSHNRLQVDDAITEALENDNLQLQGLAGQKYVQLNPMFGDSVASWQKRLGTVDAVLNTWMDVQKKWQALESIFVGSADIRVQLPEDSKRFAAVNADYQVGGGVAGREGGVGGDEVVCALRCW